jgi:hypothetical protein
MYYISVDEVTGKDSATTSITVNMYELTSYSLKLAYTTAIQGSTLRSQFNAESVELDTSITVNMYDTA